MGKPGYSERGGAGPDEQVDSGGGKTRRKHVMTAPAASLVLLLDEKPRGEARSPRMPRNEKDVGEGRRAEEGKKGKTPALALPVMIYTLHCCGPRIYCG